MVLMLLASRHLLAQVSFSVMSATEPPRDPLKFTWFYNTTDKTVSMFMGDRWKKIETDVTEIKACVSYVYMERQGEKILYRADGDSKLKIDECACLDNILGVRSGNLVAFVDINDEVLSKVMVSTLKPCVRLNNPDTLESEIVYCLPQWAEGMTETNYKAFRNWGMLSETGKWKIAPQFDQPFHFKNGVAEVAIYGVPKKINEQGEFVE